MIKHDQAYFRSRRDRHARGSHEAPLLQCRCTCSPPNRLQRVTLLCADIASQLRVLQKEVTVLPERGHAHRQGLSAERGSKASRPSLSPQGAASSRRTATALLHLQSASQNSKYHPSPPVGVPLLSLRSCAARLAPGHALCASAEKTSYMGMPAPLAPVLPLRLGNLPLPRAADSSFPVPGSVREPWRVAGERASIRCR